MGRKNRSGRIPQRSRLVANREVLRAINGERPKPFGIRRPLTFESQMPLIERFTDLVKDDDNLPDTIMVRRSNLHVTLMPLREIDAQLSRGLVLGYEFGRKAVTIEHNIKDDAPRQLVVELGRATIIKSRIVAVRVESDELDAEHFMIRQIMGRIGLRGALKAITPLHVSLGDIAKGESLSRFEKNYVKGLVNEIVEDIALSQSVKVPDESLATSNQTAFITLNPIEFYPSGYD